MNAEIPLTILTGPPAETEKAPEALCFPESKLLAEGLCEGPTHGAMEQAS